MPSQCTGSVPSHRLGHEKVCANAVNTSADVHRILAGAVARQPRLSDQMSNRLVTVVAGNPAPRDLRVGKPRPHQYPSRTPLWALTRGRDPLRSRLDRWVV